MNLPILYTFRRCPYAMRARLAIAYTKQPIIWREVILKDMPEQLLKLSPKATVPVLQLNDGLIIDESLDIMHWALQRSDPENWLDDSGDGRNLMYSLIEENDHQFKSHLDHYKYAVRYPEQTAEEYREQAEQFLQQLENHLIQTTYLAGDKRTLADVAIFPFVRQFAGVDSAWFEEAPYPKLRLWLKQLVEWELFRSVMPKYAQWKEGDTPIVFPTPLN